MAWREFRGPHLVRCVCEKAILQAAPNIVVFMRERPAFRVQGGRMLTYRCPYCKREIDLVVKEAA